MAAKVRYELAPGVNSFGMAWKDGLIEVGPDKPFEVDPEKDFGLVEELDQQDALKRAGKTTAAKADA